jgi:hypothetical protein
MNRICCHFEAGPRWAEEAEALRVIFCNVACQFAWFGADLEPRVRYEREPDFETCGWKPPKAT